LAFSIRAADRPRNSSPTSLGIDVDRFELADRPEAGKHFVELIGGDLDLDDGLAQAVVPKLHPGIRDVAADAGGKLLQLGHRILEGVDFDQRRCGSDDHAGRVWSGDRRQLGILPLFAPGG
jgi:hypothetical protein